MPHLPTDLHPHTTDARGRALRLLDEINERNDSIYALTVAVQRSLPEDETFAHALLRLLHDLANDTQLLGMLHDEIEGMRPAVPAAEVITDVA